MTKKDLTNPKTIYYKPLDGKIALKGSEVFNLEHCFLSSCICRHALCPVLDLHRLNFYCNGLVICT
jgi:hypothetical protein